MLEAIAGRAAIERSYGEALSGLYLWHEFGDVHLILPEEGPHTESCSSNCRWRPIGPMLRPARRAPRHVRRRIGDKAGHSERGRRDSLPGFSGPTTFRRTSHLCHGILRPLRMAPVAQHRGFQAHGARSGNTLSPTGPGATSALRRGPSAMTKNTRLPGHSPKLTKLHKLSISHSHPRCRDPRVLAGAEPHADHHERRRHLRGPGRLQRAADRTCRPASPTSRPVRA